VPALIKVLEDPASSECAVLIALGVLTNLRAPEAASAFLGILRRGPHRDMAARGLGWLEAREAFDDLLAAARQEEDFALRLSAIDALKRLGDARAEPLLLELLEHPHSSIRLRAAEALMRVATPAAIPRLRHWLQIEPQVRVRTALRYAIEQASKSDEAR
jgi:HEAT repeat protein